VLRFSHRHWLEGSDFLRYCSLKRATYLLGLKRLLETGEGMGGLPTRFQFPQGFGRKSWSGNVDSFGSWITMGTCRAPRWQELQASVSCA
jgi:hypothetical protein